MRIKGKHLFLSRRNLRTLLIKLDQEGSKRTIYKDGFFVTAEEDVDHYVDRLPGKMSKETEDHLKGA
jgi:hypothetical protein